jgi:hypothetical protein
MVAKAHYYLFQQVKGLRSIFIQVPGQHIAAFL